MKRYCLALDLKNDPTLIAEYEVYHRKIWPEIEKSIKDSGIDNMEIYRTGNRLFMIMETKDDFSFENKNIKTEAISWNLENEVNDLMRFDIGVYPLPFEQWVYGKSGLKALQYMALGIPTIATAIGANYRIINHGKNGFLVEKNDIQKWVEYILHIINDIDFARELGKNARKTVLEKFSVEANKEIYLNVLKSV